jgi:hypothetical protein
MEGVIPYPRRRPPPDETIGQVLTFASIRDGHAMRGDEAWRFWHPSAVTGLHNERGRANHDSAGFNR